MLWRTLVHEFHISYSHTEWRLLSSHCENCEKIWKWSSVKLNCTFPKSALLLPYCHLASLTLVISNQHRLVAICPHFLLRYLLDLEHKLVLIFIVTKMPQELRSFFRLCWVRVSKQFITARGVWPWGTLGIAILHLRLYAYILFFFV